MSDAVDDGESGRAEPDLPDRRKGRDQEVLGKPRICDGGNGDGGFRNGRKSDRECEGFQDRHREGHGQ